MAPRRLKFIDGLAVSNVNIETLKKDCIFADGLTVGKIERKEARGARNEEIEHSGQNLHA
ncbi:hypothetical protein PIB30_079091 [Stylosanthes scabra]|uniref:Uncharacterized protein n=1 Tax=Stylosanthes scabra TaxID=79078 RepID=A0ABU6XR39_9FABA|nr:hypothetical protein [Stylosanthes scabra]